MVLQRGAHACRGRVRVRVSWWFFSAVLKPLTLALILTLTPNPNPHPNPHPNPSPNPTPIPNQVLKPLLCALPLWCRFMQTPPPYISLHLPRSPYMSLYLPVSPCISLHLPTSPCISLARCRFMQALRVYHDTHKRWPALGNALKYAA